MDSKQNEALDGMFRIIEKLLQRVEKLEDEITKLKTPQPPFNPLEHI